MPNRTEVDRARGRARQRALTRLRLRHETEYDDLLLEEMRNEGFVEFVEIDDRRFWVHVGDDDGRLIT